MKKITRVLSDTRVPGYLPGTRVTGIKTGTRVPGYPFRALPPTPFRAVFAPPQPPRDNRSTSWAVSRPKHQGCGQGMARRGWGRSPKRYGRSAPRRRAGDLPALFLPRRAPMDDRSMSRTVGHRKGRDGRVFHVARQGEAFHVIFRRFATTSGFVNPLPVSRRHLYALYFLIRWAFYDILDCPGHFFKYLRFPNSTSGPTRGTRNGMPTSLFH